MQDQTRGGQGDLSSQGQIGFDGIGGEMGVLVEQEQVLKIMLRRISCCAIVGCGDAAIVYIPFVNGVRRKLSANAKSDGELS